MDDPQNSFAEDMSIIGKKAHQHCLCSTRIPYQGTGVENVTSFLNPTPAPEASLQGTRSSGTAQFRRSDNFLPKVAPYLHY